MIMTVMFCLYGMQIYLDGDVVAARDRAHLARKLMFQTKLVNVNDLDIIKGNLKLDDGTTVQVLSQHGLDSARIYVPPRVSGGKQKRREEKESITGRYIPAFDAYIEAPSNPDQNDHIGYILCHGDGFNGPYEFVPRTRDNDVDPFQYGQWMEWYENRPFDDLDEYLKYNPIYQDPERILLEIPPIGTNNRIFDGLAESNYQGSGALGGESCELCTYAWNDGVFAQNNVNDSFTVSISYGYQKQFTMGPEGESGYIPPDTTGSGGGAGKELMSTVLSAGTMSIASQISRFGTSTFSPSATWASDAATAISILNSEYDCNTCVSLYKEAEFDPLLWQESYDDVNNCLTGVIFYGRVPREGTEIGYPWVTYFEEYSAHQKSNDRRYQTKYSSAHNGDEYAVAFFFRDQTISGENSGVWDNCPLSSECIPVGEITTATTQSGVKAILGGEEHIIGGYSSSIINDVIELQKTGDIVIRYYKDGPNEFMLGGASVATSTGAAESKYFYAWKDKQFDGTAIFDCREGRPYQAFPYETEIEGLTYKGAPIKMVHRFRLIKEIVRKREVIDGIA